MHHLLSRSALVALLASITAASGAATALAADPPTRSDKAPVTTSDRGESSGDNCEQDFRDSANELWDIDGNEGYVDDGTSDAYDSYGYAYVGDAEEQSWDYYYGDSDACSFEEDGRELVMPTDEVSFDNTDGDEVVLELQRKIYVPAEGAAFARWLDIVTNPSEEESASFNYDWYGEYGEIADGDEGVRTIDSFDGDEMIDIGEPWGAFRHDYDGNSHVSSLWDGVGGDGWDFPYQDEEYNIPGRDGGSDSVDFVYDTTTLAPGESAVFMHVEHQNTVGDSEDRGQDNAEDAAAFEETAAFARAHEAGSDEVFAGMSEEELEALRNWTPDSDRDGVLQFEDNCTDTANPDQADLDRDGEGDACDDDIDGDGLTNAQESRMGMNPANADTDGDGSFDGIDRCPTRAGTQSDGCPEGTTTTTQVVQANQTLVPVQRLRARRLTANVSRKAGDDRLRVRTRGRLLLPAGMSALEGCKGQVLVTVKAGKRTVSTRRATLADDCTYRSRVTFTDLRRLGNRKLNVQATFQGNSRLFRQRAKKDYIGRA